MSDTKRTWRFVGSVTVGAGWIAAAMTLFGCAHSGGPAASGLHVIWARDATVYVAGSDSIRLDTGTLVVIRNGARPIASGHVDRVVDGTLAVVSLTSGPFPLSKKWAELSVSAERGAFTAAPLLRLGYPANGRRWFATICQRRPIPPEGLATSYRSEVIAERSWRGVRVSAPSASTSAGPTTTWPDTLLLRLFDDAADEEIALLRGEVDAAIFWPDETSRYLLEQWSAGTALRGAWRPPANAIIDWESPSARAAGTACPIVTTAAWKGYLQSLGPDSLVNLLRCEPKSIDR